METSSEDKEARRDLETIIIFNEGDKAASIYTHSPKWQKHIEEQGVKPWRKQGKARDYEIPKAWLRLPRPPSEKRAAATRARVQSGVAGFGRKRAETCRV